MNKEEIKQKADELVALFSGRFRIEYGENAVEFDLNGINIAIIHQKKIIETDEKYIELIKTKLNRNDLRLAQYIQRVSIMILNELTSRKNENTKAK